MKKFKNGDVVKIIKLSEKAESLKIRTGQYFQVKKYIGVKEDTNEDYYLLEGLNIIFAESELEAAENKEVCRLFIESKKGEYIESKVPLIEYGMGSNHLFIYLRNIKSNEVIKKLEELNIKRFDSSDIVGKKLQTISSPQSVRNIFRGDTSIYYSFEFQDLLEEFRKMGIRILCESQLGATAVPFNMILSEQRRFNKSK